MRSLFFECIVSFFLFLLLVSAPLVGAQIRSSSNYQIERDTINVAGGFGTSSSYQLNTSVGETAPGRGTSTNYILTAGYQQQDAVTLTLSGGAPVVMDTEIGGVSGGTSRGSSSVHASTDGPAGYQLTIQASQTPAMQSGVNTIADYTPAGAAADTNFVTGTNDAHLAFSPFGDDIVNRYRVSGSTCGSGSASSTACWDGLSTTPATMVSAAGANAPAGATTTVYFAVGIGGSVIQPPGTYVATTTITLLSL